MIPSFRFNADSTSMDFDALSGAISFALASDLRKCERARAQNIKSRGWLGITRLPVFTPDSRFPANRCRGGEEGASTTCMASATLCE